MKKITIYHNARCSKSRATLSLIEEHGISPIIRDYLANPPSLDELRSISQKLNLRPKDFIRQRESDFIALKLDVDDDEAVFKAIHQFPKILERPIVVAQEQAVIGRPPEKVKEILLRT